MKLGLWTGGIKNRVDRLTARNFENHVRRKEAENPVACHLDAEEGHFENVVRKLRWEVWADAVVESRIRTPAILLTIGAIIRNLTAVQIEDWGFVNDAEMRQRLQGEDDDHQALVDYARSVLWQWSRKVNTSPVKATIQSIFGRPWAKRCRCASWSRPSHDLYSWVLRQPDHAAYLVDIQGHDLEMYNTIAFGQTRQGRMGHRTIEDEVDHPVQHVLKRVVSKFGPLQADWFHSTAVAVFASSSMTGMRTGAHGKTTSRML